MLKYATDNDFSNPSFFIDYGISRVTVDRPGWNEMIRLAGVGKSNTGDCAVHFIREDTLKRFVQCRIFDVTALSFDNEGAFTERRAYRGLRKRKSVSRNLTAFTQGRFFMSQM